MSDQPVTSLIAGVPAETFPGERRVAVVPSTIPALTKAGFRVLVESNAGKEAGFSDGDYTQRGAEIVTDRTKLFADATVILQVRAAVANRTADSEVRPTDEPNIAHLKDGQIVIAMCDPLTDPASMQPIAAKGVSCFALEMVPRITRAQSMDVLSSMATVAGYKAVLMAADAAPRMFPMLMTAAGTVTPARVFIIGAGVAGLQAIATARRLGAVVHAYDIRPDVKEQVESLGGRFVELDLETNEAEGAGGYAKSMDEEFYRKQREKMTEVIAESDVVITTAAVPGKKAPILVTAEMVHAMRPGSLLVDLAAERGGNCELTKPDETIHENGIAILGPCNLPTTIPVHASEMFSKNITTLLLSLVKDGAIHIDKEDEVVAGTLVTHGGEVVHPMVREALGLEPLEQPAAVEEKSEEPAEESQPEPTDGDAKTDDNEQESS